jgi:flagellar protein FliS
MYESRQGYLQTDILHAEPVELVRVLYRAAIEAVSSARAALQAGDIGARATAISKASSIVNELAHSLDHQAGGEISRQLVELYDYIVSLLHDANYRQVEAPLVEAKRLLETLLEAWENCRPAATPPIAEPVEYTPVNCAL